jgi:hypothetical protein
MTAWRSTPKKVFMAHILMKASSKEAIMRARR